MSAGTPVSLGRHSREGRNPFPTTATHPEIPGFAGMTFPDA